MKRYHLLGTALLLSLLATACSKPEKSAKASGPPPASVKLQALQTNTLQDSTEFVGTLEAERTVELKPQTDGRIDQILVKPGAQVNQGDLLFLLNPDQSVPQLNSAQANVNAVVAARNSSAQQLQVAQSQLTSAQSQYELAQINNNRSQFLARQGAIPQSQADQSATDLKVRADAVRSARDQVSAAKAAVSQAEANIRKAQSDAAAAEVSVNFRRVVAPISGAIGNITLKVGDYVKTGDSLTTINQNDAFDLQIPIPLSRSGQLRTGLPVQLLDPNTGNLLGSGNIYFVSSQADPNAQSLLTRARFLNTGSKLRNSQYVRARVIWNTMPGILVPVESVTTIGGQSFVFVAKETQANGKSQMVAHQVPVTLGNIQGQNQQVLRGLQPGDTIIVSGILRLRDGAPIAPQAGNGSPASGSGTPNSPRS